MSQQSAGTGVGTREGETRELVLRDHGTGVEVSTAPKWTKVTLEVVVHNDRGVRMRGNMISFGGHEGQWVSYEVMALTDENRCLLLRRED